MTESRPQLRDSYEGLLERARTLVRAGQLEDAIATYRRLVTRLASLSDKVLMRRPELAEMHRQARLELSGILHGEGRYADEFYTLMGNMGGHGETPDDGPSEMAVSFFRSQNVWDATQTRVKETGRGRVIANRRPVGGFNRRRSERRRSTG